MWRHHLLYLSTIRKQLQGCRSHASVRYCVIANSLSMVIANSLPRNLKWKKGGCATEPLSKRSTMATHQNMAEWIDEKPSMSRADVSDSYTEASVYISSFFPSQKGPLSCLCTYFIWVSRMLSLMTLNSC